MATNFDISNRELYTIICSESKDFLKEFGGKKGIAKRLCTDLKKGISEDEDLNTRRFIYGVNKYPEKPSASWLELFFEAFQDIAIIILTIAAAVALAAGIAEEALKLSQFAWIEGIAIIVAVIIVASVGATNDVLKDRKFQALRDSTEGRKPLTVIRGGKYKEIIISELCTGDILCVPPGGQIPADGLFLETEEDREISVNMSNFNGESVPRKVNKEGPFLISGTELVEGKCNMLVLAVGPRSSYGRLAAALIKQDEQTPLEAKLEDMVVTIGWIGLGFSIAVFIVLMSYYIDSSVVHPHYKSPCLSNINGSVSAFWLRRDEVLADSSIPVGTYILGCPPDNSTEIDDPAPVFRAESLTELLRAFIVSITIIVVAVPEGLPLAVTISLAYSVGIMLKDNNLVRHLRACETMGGATNICSDKTGTLTQNKMTILEGIIIGAKFSDPSEIEADQNTMRIGDTKLNEDLTETALESLLHNIDNAELQIEDGHVKMIGNPTEASLLVFAEKILSATGRSHKEFMAEAQKVKKWSFTSAKKRMSTVVRHRNGYRLLCKGASERIVALCKYELQQDGNLKKLDKKARKNYQSLIDEFAEKEMRVIGLAYKDFDKEQKWDTSDTGEEFETDMILVGLVGIMDPLRPEVPEAVRKCKRAGITVRMVTGDFKLTARAIALKCGILTDGIVLEGKEFQMMKDSELKELLDRNAEKKLQVLARSSPDDKKRLVELIKELDEVVAVTGDGTNDAPAFTAAHVGLAMNAGTDVAKNAADIVIIDNNFASIVNAVKWGRCVFDNIRKFLQFQLTVNVVALGLAFIGAITQAGTPLTAVQLLWVNLIMDSMAALALGTERPTESLLFRKPHGMRGKLITPLMWRNIIGQALFQIAWLCAILYAVDLQTGMHRWLPDVEGSWSPGAGEHILEIPTEHYTVIFNSFVLMQAFNEINSRKVNLDMNVFEGFFSNPSFSIVLFITFVLQALIVEFGDRAFMTTHLRWDLWLICVAIGISSLPAGAIIRLVKVPLEDWEKISPEVE